MRKQIAIIADKLTLPIDEGLKKLTYKMMEYGLKRNDVDVYNSPEDIALSGVTLYHANKLMKSAEIKSLLNKKKYTDIYYIPEASTTFYSFVRAIIIQIQAPSGAFVHIVSCQRRKLKVWQKIIVKLIWRNEVVTFSRSAEKYFRDMNIKTYCCTNGVDCSIYKPIDKEQKDILRIKYNIPRDRKIVLHVGHVRKTRNIAILEKLQDNGLQVIVVGSTSMAYEEDLASDLKSKGVIIIGEFIPHIEELYQLSDLYIFPVELHYAAIEFPLSILEAMACELPILTTRFGALPDTFTETDVFKYYDTPDEMVQYAQCLVKQDGKENRRIVQEKFTWEKVFEKMIKS